MHKKYFSESLKESVLGVGRRSLWRCIK